MTSMRGIEGSWITKAALILAVVLSTTNCKPTNATAKPLSRVHRLRHVSDDVANTSDEPVDLTHDPRCPRAFEFDYNCDVAVPPSSQMVGCVTNEDCGGFKQHGDLCCSLPCSNVGCVDFSHLVRVGCRGDGDEIFLPGDEYIRNCKSCTCGPDGRGICSPAMDCYTVQKDLFRGIMDRQNSPPEGTPEPSEAQEMLNDMLEADKTIRGKVLEENRLSLEKIFNNTKTDAGTEKDR